MRLFVRILLGLLIACTLGACTKEEPIGVENESKALLSDVRAHLADYTLVRADRLGDQEQKAFLALRDAIVAVTGVRPASASDCTASYPVREREIAVGRTARDALISGELSLASGEGWSVTADGKRLYFRYESETAHRAGAAALLQLLAPDMDTKKGKELIMSALLARDAFSGVTAVPGGCSIAPSADTYIRSGSSYEKENYGSAASLEIKALASPGYSRKILIRFPLDALEQSDIVRAALRLYATALETTELPGGKIIARLYDGDWEEGRATYLNADGTGDALASAYVSANAWCEVDLTEAVRTALHDGRGELSLLLTGDYSQPLLMRFNSSEAGANTPELRVITDADAASSVALIPAAGTGKTEDVWQYAGQLVDEYLLWKSAFTEQDAKAERRWGGQQEYPLTSQAGAAGGAKGVFSSRTPDILPGYDTKGETPERSEYGGRMDIQREATGYFRVEELDGRVWLIDPIGHPYLAAAIGYVCPGTSDSQRARIRELYGTDEAWAEEAADTLKNDFAFTAVTHLSRPELLGKTENPLPYAHTFSFLAGYARSVGAAQAGAGHCDFVDNGTMPVFDPAFADYCDRYAASLAGQYGSDPWFIGYMSDNELPVSLLMLDNSLSLLPENARSVYTYAVAHTWLRAVTGKSNAGAADITDALRAQYCEFVYDRYFRVVTEAIRRYDENHLYLGCRFMYPGYLRECFLRSAGRWCDVVTMNYYFVWEPDADLMTDWKKWGAAPFLITEFYLKAEDSGLPNTAGAGRTGKTQTDRADYYSTYVLKLLESGWCVGWSWLQYWDNDPASGTQDVTSTNSNKGIYNSRFKPYTVLTDRMTQINQHMYTLADYFDARQ